MRILALTRYSALGASSRLRTYQFVAKLRLHGLEVRVQPLMSDRYLELIYNRHRPGPLFIMACYARRAWLLARLRNYSYIWLEKEAFPFLPWWIERFILSLSGRRVVVDYDDAIFHRYDQLSWPASAIYGRKISCVMRNADCVIAGNGYLADYAVAARASMVIQIPTVVDPAKYNVHIHENRDRPIIGWIGTPKTAQYLGIVYPILKALHAEGHRFKLMTIGSGGLPPLPFPTESRLWTEATEGNDVSLFDIGIMPLPDQPWERGKCGYKLVQYMASGVPVIASPVGVNRTIVVEGITGFLASDSRSWKEALVSLLADADRRRTMGMAGRQRATLHYSIASAVSRLSVAFRSLPSHSNRT